MTETFLPALCAASIGTRPATCSCSCTCRATPTQSLRGVRLIAFLPFVHMQPTPSFPPPPLYALLHTTRALIASSTRGVHVGGGGGRGQLPLCNIVSLQTLAIAIAVAVAFGPLGPLQHPLPLPLRCLPCSFLPLTLSHSLPLSVVLSLWLVCVGSLISIWIVACQ